MDKSILYNMMFFSQDINYEIINRCCEMAYQFFVPIYMSGNVISNRKTRKFNSKKFYNDLTKEIEEGIHLRLSDNENMLWIIKKTYVDIVVVTIIVNNGETNPIDELIDELTAEKAIVGIKCSLCDNVMQNTQEIDSYKRQGGKTRNVKIVKDKYGNKVIDTEYNPGHSHRPRNIGIWFGSCHKMWFGKPYYDYISKEKLKNFTNCYENIELANEVIRITLYEDIWAYDEKKNRKIQWDFRKSVGMDEVAHALENAPKNKETDASIEITNGIFPNGGVKMIKYYYDSSNELISKSKAVKVRICEFAQDGTLLFEEEKEM